MTTIYWQGKIQSAHKLKLPYDSPCRNLHGHCWKVEFWITGKPDKYGMVYDFNKLNKLIKALDHKDLNKIVKFNPTAENIADYLSEHIMGENLKGVRVRVWEDPTSYAEVEYELNASKFISLEELNKRLAEDTRKYMKKYENK